MKPKLMLPLLVCPVFSIVMFYCVFIICRSAYRSFEPAAVFTMIGMIYINIVVFWYFDRIKSAFEYKRKSEAAELKIELQKQYFEILDEHQQATDALWHDMKKHINLMKLLINEGQHKITSEYIHQLEAQMDSKVKIIRTEYPVLSALLTEQEQRAKKANIAFDIDVRLASDMRIAPVDLCVILGNLFDNAFEACLFLEVEIVKYIKISIVQRNNAVAIKVENSFFPAMQPERRSGKHGIGLRNVRQTANKYGGKIDVATDNGAFMVSILFP